MGVSGKKRICGCSVRIRAGISVRVRVRDGVRRRVKLVNYSLITALPVVTSSYPLFTRGHAWDCQPPSDYHAHVSWTGEQLLSAYNCTHKQVGLPWQPLEVISNKVVRHRSRSQFFCAFLSAWYLQALISLEQGLTVLFFNTNKKGHSYMALYLGLLQVMCQFGHRLQCILWLGFNPNIPFLWGSLSLRSRRVFLLNDM